MNGNRGGIVRERGFLSEVGHEQEVNNPDLEPSRRKPVQMTRWGPERGLPGGVAFPPIQSYMGLQPSLCDGSPNLLLEALALPGGCKLGNT